MITKTFLLPLNPDLMRLLFFLHLWNYYIIWLHQFTDVHISRFMSKVWRLLVCTYVHISVVWWSDFSRPIWRFEKGQSLLLEFIYPGLSSEFYTPGIYTYDLQNHWTLTINCPVEDYTTSHCTMWMNPDLSMQTTELSARWSCSAQNVHDRQKSLCGCCSFQKGLNGSYSPTLSTSSITFFWLQQHVRPCSYKCTRKTHNRSSPRTQTTVSYSLGNSSLAAETVRQLVACLFPPLLCFQWNVT